MRLIKEIVKQCKDKEGNKYVNDEGVEYCKSYTNFKLVITVGDNEIQVPIQPVNFGKASNRRNYSLLNSAATLKEENPFV